MILFCSCRSSYLPLNGARKPFCLLAAKQRDVETSSLFTASLCGCCCSCSVVQQCCLLLCRAYKCAKRTMDVVSLRKRRQSFCRICSGCWALFCCFVVNLHFVGYSPFDSGTHTSDAHKHINALIPVHKSHSGCSAHI